MPAEPFAGPAEYAERTGQALSDIQHVQVATLLAEASAIMRAQIGDLDERVAAGTVDRVIAAGVCVRMVQRHLANPHAASSRSATTGPFSEAESWSNQQASRTGLYLTDDDRAALGATTAVVGARGPAGSIRVGLPTAPRNPEAVTWWRL